MIDDDRSALLALFEAYATRHPARARVARGFSDFARRHPDCRERSQAVGHFTASAFLVSADGRRTLLTHHAKLGRWLQPGGHLDGDRVLALAALREASEESGLPGLVVEPEVFDLDRHWIPTRGAELGHWHYDVRFVVRATVSEAFVVSSESLALAWRDVREVAGDPASEASLARMARGWLARARPWERDSSTRRSPAQAMIRSSALADRDASPVSRPKAGSTVRAGPDQKAGSRIGGP